MLYTFSCVAAPDFLSSFLSVFQHKYDLTIKKFGHKEFRKTYGCTLVADEVREMEAEVDEVVAKAESPTL